MVRIFCDDGSEGTGYSYTIGNGGSSVIALLRDHLAPRLLGQGRRRWSRRSGRTCSSTPTPPRSARITSIALCVVDTALWDRRCRAAGLPLHVHGGRCPAPDPGVRHRGRLAAPEAGRGGGERAGGQGQGFPRASRSRSAGPHVAEDVARLAAVRKALGPAFDIMTDANQGFTVSEAIRRARHYEALDVVWFEEPLPAEDLNGHVLLSQSTSIPIAIGESLYHPGAFPRVPAARRVQHRPGRRGPRGRHHALAQGGAPGRDVQRAGLSALPDGDPSRTVLRGAQRHLAGAHSAAGRDHALARVDRERLRVPSKQPGLGIEWDWKAIERRRNARRRSS